MKVSPESTSKMMKNKHEKEEPQKIAPNYVTPTEQPPIINLLKNQSHQCLKINVQF